MKSFATCFTGFLLVGSVFGWTEEIRELGEAARADVRAARAEMDDGTAAYPPQVGTGQNRYNNFWLRDYAYALEGAADVIPEKELLAVAELFAAKLGPDGSGVDCIRFDRTPWYRPGGDKLGENPVADGGPFTVAVGYLTWKRTGATSLLRRDYLDRLARALRAVPRNPSTGLVHISDKTPYDRAPYGFTDCVKKEGDVLFTSLLDIEAARRLAEMYRAAGRLDDAEREDARAESVVRAVNGTLWDEASGLYLAATKKCRQADIWGSAFAVHLGVASPARSRRIASVFRANYDGLVWHGQIRHLLPGTYWEEIGGSVREKDFYQNGGFWGVPTGWFVETLMLSDGTLAEKTLRDFVAFGRTYGYPEFVARGKDGKPFAKLPRYLATSCVPYAVLSKLAAPSERTSLSLDGEWRLDWFEQPDDGAVRELPLRVPYETVRATVPGNCELDLQRAGVLPEMEKGTNCWIRWFEGNEYLYTKTFVAPVKAAGGRTELVFEGIDTLADVFLNGEKIGETENMFVPHRFDVTDRLKPGENTVQVLIRSILLESQKKVVGIGGHCKCVPGGAELEPFRKPAHAVGWDILPRLMARGLWRSVRLETGGAVRIADPAWFVGNVLDNGKGGKTVRLAAMCRMEAPFRYLDRAKVRYALSLDGKEVLTREHPFRHYQPAEYFALDNPRLWWPKGSGEPALHVATIEIVDADGTVLARDSRKIGLRHVELVRDDNYGPDRPGEFVFKVNGEKIYIRGANWTPLDAYHGRDAEHLGRALGLVEDLNCNMLRIWGGGVYESEAFYDWCDAHGVMVWQDFMTAGSVFPQGDEYAKLTREEAISVATRLRNHPSVALWSGNNENDCAYWDNWLRKLVRVDPNTDRPSRETLPRVLREFDPTRPYLPSSPYFSPEVVAGKAHASEGHIWGARQYYKVPFYTNNPCCFVSELGFHGCPNRASLEQMMTSGKLYPWTDVKTFDWNKEWRCKGTMAYDDPTDGIWNRNSIMVTQTRLMFGRTPTDFNEFVVASQIFQAEAMKTLVELYRARKFHGMNGFIWWNVRDGWPIISDAVVDYYFGKKAAYYATQTVHGDELVAVLDDHSVWAVNDRLHAVKGQVKIRDLKSGKTLMNRDYEVASNDRMRLGYVPFAGQGLLVIDYVVDGYEGRNHFLYGEIPFKLDEVCVWLKNGCYPLPEGVSK